MDEDRLGIVRRATRPIRRVVMAGMGLVAVVMAAFGLYGLVALSRTQGAYQRLQESPVLSTRVLPAVSTGIWAVRAQQWQQVVGADARSAAQLSQLEVRVDEGLAVLGKAGLTTAEKQAFDALMVAWSTAKEERARALRMGAAGNRQGAAAATGADSFQEVARALSELQRLATERAVAEASLAAQGATAAQGLLGGGLLVGLALAVGLGLLVGGQVSRPFQQVVVGLEAIASGDLTWRPEMESGELSEALEASFGRIRGTMQAIAVDAQALITSLAELKTLNAAMAESLEKTVVQAGTVETASQDVTLSVDLVVMGVEDMNSSIKEIAKNVTEALKVATAAVRIAELTNTNVGRLGESSAEIGKVIKLITSIAEQTNFLALNATIEAARAGEAGHGFAVVANEVKELAKETARATDDVSPTLETIQTDSKRAIESITQISSIVSQINDLQSAIAGAVEQQTATATEMVRGINETSAMNAKIASAISGFTQAAKTEATYADAAVKAVDEANRAASSLQSLLEQVKV